MNLGYEFSLVGEAARTLIALPPKRRRKAMALIEGLAADPFTEPDLRDNGPSGRTYSILVRDDLLLTYWVDHAAKDLRVLRIEFV